MKVKSTHKFVMMSPRKLRVVADLAREMSPKEAYERLPYIGKRAAIPLRKVISSALANAKQKGLKEEDLEFSEIQINEGPRLKRWRAGARGRAKPYLIRMSNIRVILGVKTKKAGQKATAGNKKLGRFKPGTGVNKILRGIKGKKKGKGVSAGRAGTREKKVSKRGPKKTEIGGERRRSG